MTATVVRALITAHVSETVQLHAGELWAADDDLVIAHPEWFSADLIEVARRTSAPKTDVQPRRRQRTADEKLED